MRYEPKIGDEFKFAKDVIVAKTSRLTERTRSAIALAVVMMSVLALLFCAYRGEFQALQTVWNVVAVPLGCILGYYFRGHDRNGQEDNAGPT
jgi:hypothetical protein